MTKALFNIDDNKPECTSSLFTLINPVEIDDSKETVCMITSNILTDEHNYIFGFCYSLYKILKTKYNVIIVGKEKKSQKLLCEVENAFIFNGSGYKEINKKFHRKKENENNVEYNMNLLNKEIDLALKDFNVSKVIYTDDIYSLPPLTSYYKDYKDLYNEFFDYVGSDKKEIERRTDMIKDLNKRYDHRVSILAFSMYFKNLFMKVTDSFIRKNPNLTIYHFIIDPTAYTFLHEGIYDTKTIRYYFADDNRGTRNMKKFPIAQLQHITYEKEFYKNFNSYNIDFEDKKKNLFFIGSILQTKGTRIKMWDKYLRNFNDDKSGLWVPLRLNGVIKNKKHEKSIHVKNAELKAENEHNELYNSIKNHSNYKGHILPLKIRETIKDYRYGLVLRCISHNDSLNYRPVYYASMGIIPLLDEKYDPDYLMIPKSIQDYIVVKDHEDIQNKINYFNNNPSIAKKIIKDLRNIFEIDTYLNYSQEDLEQEILKYFI